jgi:hypothetical protein
MPLHGFDPVYVWDGYVSRGIVDVEGAARFLAERWPFGEHKLSYLKAARDCRAVLEESLPAAAARASLVDAAIAAQILDRKSMDAPVITPTGKPKTHWHKS